MTLLQDRIAATATRFFHSLRVENESENVESLLENQISHTQSKNMLKEKETLWTICREQTTKESLAS